MAEQAYAYVTLIPVAKGFQKAVAKEMGGVSDTTGQVGKEAGGRFTKSFGGAVRGIGGLVAGGLAAVGAGKFLKGSITEASNLEESLNAVSVAYGESASGIEELGTTAASRLGLAQTEFNAIATQFSAFGDQIAGEGGDVVGVIDDLSTRGADFASVFNLDVDDALTKFQAGLAGETEPLRKFGVDLSAAAVEAFAYESGIAQVGQTLTEEQKVQARYGALMEQTSKVEGDRANTADGLANAQRTLSATFQDMQASVGKALVPAFASLATAMVPLVEELGPVLTEVMEALAPVFADLVGQLPALLEAFIPLIPVIGLLATLFVELLTAVLPIITGVLTGAISILGNFASWITANADALKPWLVALAAAAAVIGAFAIAANAAAIATAVMTAVTKAARAAQMLFNLVLLANPIMLVVAAIAALVAGLVFFFTQTEAGKEAWAAFTEFLGTLWEGLKAGFAAMLESFAALWEWFKGIPALIMEALLAAGEFLLEAGKSILQGLFNGILFVWDLLGEWFRNLFNLVLGFFATAAEWLVQAGKNILQGLWNGILLIWELIKFWYIDLPRLIVGFFISAITWLVQAGRNILQGMWDGILFVWDLVWSWLGNLGDLIIGLFSSAGSWLFSAGRSIMNGLFDGLKSMFDKVVGWVKGLGDRITDAFKKVLRIFSPSQVFYGLGQNIGEGLIMGLESMENAIDAETSTMLTVPKPNAMRSATMDSGRSVNYYAAPNKSFDAEQELRLAMTRARVLA